MSRRLIGLTAVLAWAVALSPSDGEAQLVPSPYRFVDTRHDVSLTLGFVQGNRGELRLGPGGGLFTGVRYGIKVGGPFALEGGTFLLDTDREIWDPAGEEGPERLGTASALVSGLEGRVRFTVTGPRTWRGLAPYVAAGGGVTGEIFPGSTLEDELSAGDRFSFGPSFLGILGAGFRWLPGDRFGLRAETNLFLWKLGTPRTYLEMEDELGPVPRDEWTGVAAVLLGGSLRF